MSEDELIDAAQQGDTELFFARLAVCKDQNVLYMVAIRGIQIFEDKVMTLYVRPVLEKIEDVNYLPAEEWLPLINQIIEHSPSDNQTTTIQLLELLLEKGANPNDSRHWLPLMHTIDAEADAFNQGEIPPKTDVLQLLLQYGANPALTDGKQVGATPLKLAKEYQFQAAIEVLEQQLRSKISV